ncbi:hypothetical protein [Streptomyces sp. NPDC051561]|uniref:hypothetical protein n=1 Tax=Streptomyces sp. NPDC051561 TaxID=3365658 RepID=UPI0037917682
MQETWQTDEFGRSHEGRVGVLLVDGSVPKEVYFDGASSYGTTSTWWGFYDGGEFHGPRAASLRAVCTCGWEGETHLLDWEAFGQEPLREAGYAVAGQCSDDWEEHVEQVEKATVGVPKELTGLLEQVRRRCADPAAESPVAVLKVARQLEVLAGDIGYEAAHEAQVRPLEEVAAGLGIDPEAARRLLARFGRWNLYG